MPPNILIKTLVTSSSDSKTSKAARAAFQKLKSKIKDDDSLSESQKRTKIDEISRIREAAMLVPSNVTGAQKAKLMNLIIEQRRLKMK